MIDDNAVNRSILLEQLQSWQAEAVACANGAEGLALLGQAAEYGLSVDAVILDYHMPDMNGADVLEAMRADPALDAIPVICLTSVDQASVEQNLKALGAQATLTKPARASLLVQAIAEAIGHDGEQATGEELAVPIAVEAPGMHTPMPPENEAPEVPAAQPESGGLDVLVAEDNEINQLLIEQILADYGCTFKIVENGRLAVAAYKLHQPRLILMDVSMPEMNGHEATRAIREIETQSGGHVPIVGVTAHALKGDMEKCLDAGMDDYLSKPISPNKVEEKIRHWLDQGDLAAKSA